MKKLALLGILALSSLFATDEAVFDKVQAPETMQSSQVYLNLGLGPLPIPFPVFGIGGRFQQGHHGFDVSMQVTTIVALTAVKENLLYLYYFKPRLASQFYVGAGVGLSEIFIRHHHQYRLTAFVSPEIVLGKEYINEAGDRRFFQAQIDAPFFRLNRVHKHHTMGSFPIVVLSYGICF